ncbi:hypothetical protein Rvan_1890 [Rhodomicrobium vannielii ATCC 17100]|uniref:Uncharacterized protein n=1 Tax=Rhodomicrobium vannielii (strain ATCC 17100 / DSM 162 / LMG 4299 / NCIMB 10020 / ATH 3.1.1) TaxID=648757 RepID=E3I093_RHOVT|nr:hypothetical protein [Rhodomicrobium vannielii]ADP71128.1 hypothetical protein Rvan_1890 [Rhodomicrobium vannielii ATCC 17100]
MSPAVTGVGKQVAGISGKFGFTSDTGLKIDATIEADDLFEEFYADYDKAFVLENEKETFEGFVRCFALNGGETYAQLALRYGPFREFALVARDPSTGARIGGANFTVFLLPASASGGVQTVSINLNYIFINLSERKRGKFRRLVSDLPDIAMRLFQQTNPDDALRETRSQLPIFIEQNDPFRMSPDQYDRDTSLTGVDQISRIKIWASLGARIVDTPYVQPPLSADQAPDTTLVYAVLGLEDETVGTCLLSAHLERFFSISVLKGKDASTDGCANAQITELRAKCLRGEKVPLLPGSDFLARGTDSNVKFASREQ